MRQIDDIPFAITLGKLGRGEKLTDEEFKSFVECETTTTIDHTKHLFKTNREVDNYNDKKMQTLNTEHAISLPIDTIMGTASEKKKIRIGRV